MKVRYFIMLLIPAFLITSTVGIYFFEFILPGSEESKFSSVFNSLWWTVVTFTTVGYGDMSPETVPGQIFTFIVMAAGLINFSIIVSLDVIHQYIFGYNVLGLETSMPGKNSSFFGDEFKNIFKKCHLFWSCGGVFYKGNLKISWVWRCSWTKNR